MKPILSSFAQLICTDSSLILRLPEGFPDFSVSAPRAICFVASQMFPQQTVLPTSQHLSLQKIIICSPLCLPNYITCYLKQKQRPILFIIMFPAPSPTQGRSQHLSVAQTKDVCTARQEVLHRSRVFFLHRNLAGWIKSCLPRGPRNASGWAIAQHLSPKEIWRTMKTNLWSFESISSLAGEAQFSFQRIIPLVYLFCFNLKRNQNANMECKLLNNIKGQGQGGRDGNRKK